MNSCLGQGRVLPLHRMARRKKGLLDDSLLRLGLIVLGRWLRRGWRDVPGSRGRLHESETVNESFCFWAATLQLAGGTAFNAVRLQWEQQQQQQQQTLWGMYCTIDCAIERANRRLSYPDFGRILR